MRAFIAALLAASVFAAGGAPKGAYDYAEGGANWGTRGGEDDTEDEKCQSGKKQSPINLPTNESMLTKTSKTNLDLAKLSSNTVKSRT